MSTQESLQRYADRKQRPFDSLSSLSNVYTSFWHDPEILDMADSMRDQSKSYFTFNFEEEAKSWVEGFSTTLKKGSPFFKPAPDDVLSDLATEPARIRDKAWPVMFYGIVLTTTSSEGTSDDVTKSKLRWNIWLSLNDARLLLEPSDLNIQALTLLAFHVQDFSTPSLCWMLVTNACRMLQALGINSRMLDEKTRERRMVMFWFLNMLDKSLALIFGRPPTFHRAMCDEVPMIPVQKLTDFHPHQHFNSESFGEGNAESKESPSLFGAHFLHQMYQLSRVMSNIWSFLFDAGSIRSGLDKNKQDLDAWYRGATKILEASILTETPLLDIEAQESMQLGLETVRFHYHYLVVLLTRSSTERRLDCLHSAQKALSLLQNLVSDSEEVFNGVVWQLLYCPFTPFFVLFGEILSNQTSAEVPKYLEAMNHLSRFLDQMKPRHQAAAKLHPVALAFVQHARSIVSKEPRTDEDLNAECHSLEVQKSSNNDGSSTQQHPADVEPLPISSETTGLEGFDPDLILGFLTDLPELPHAPEEDIAMPPLHLNEPSFDWFAWDSYFQANNSTFQYNIESLQ